MVLGPDDARPARPRRVLVAGTSGSGKTTLAATVGEVLGLPHVEIDALFHGPGWTPRASFIADVDAFTRQDRWVTEWQYSAVRDLLADRADLLVWLDLPRVRVMRQVIRRTLRRRVRRQPLWNGNLEPALWTVLRDPDHIVRWAWRTHAQSAERIGALQERRPDLPIVRLTGHHETRSWIHNLRAAAPDR
ncbi:MAG TPA: AAA family ATPase [Actinomycetes bacterium]|nr:AAA family ATPase [Actinomycetes bacterium]